MPLIWQVIQLPLSANVLRGLGVETRRRRPAAAA
jgi:hypothetical protein